MILIVLVASGLGEAREEAGETVQCTVQLPDAVADTIKDTINVNVLLLLAALPYNTLSIFVHFMEEEEEKCERFGDVFYSFGIVNYLTWCLYYLLIYKIFTKNV